MTEATPQRHWAERRWVPLALFAIGVAVFSVVAGPRTMKQSPDPHFVFQAHAWLNGHLAIDPPPEKGDDWAKIETALLDDGTQVRGRRLTGKRTKGIFRTTTGEDVSTKRIARSLGTTHYVAFPPFPAVLMLPQTALHGRKANDVVPTILVAALVLPLMFLTLGRLRREGLSRRTPVDDLWLTACLAFGTVFFAVAVQGRVWFTAHVIGVALATGYVYCSVRAKNPIGAGLCLALATVTRSPMLLMMPLFVWEAWRVAGGDRRQLVRTFVKFAAPLAIIGIAAAVHNWLRYDAPGEFGHSYLAVRQQAQMEESGLFSLDYLSRNLTVAFTLLPTFSSESPYVILSNHGLAMWFTTPILFFLLWPRERGPWHRPLWLAVALVAIPGFLYQNSGWIQFGYRFSLDFMPLLIVLLAVGGRPLGRLARGLIVVAVAVNLFGAVTLRRHHQFYKGDDYGVIIRH